jgi:cytochrome P450
VTSENEKWRRGRTLLTHAMRIDILEDLPAVALASADVVLHQLEAAAKAGDKVDMAKAFHRLTLQVIGRAVLSLPAEECDRVFPSLYLPIVDECNRRVWEPWRYGMPWLHDYRRHRTCLNDLNAYLTELIQTRWAQRQRGERDEAKGVKADVLDLYMSQIQKMDGDMVRQLRDDIKTMLLAGHETTAAMLTWTLYELLSNPELAAKVREEHQAVLGHINFVKGELPTLADIGKLTWTLASLREALRLYSVVPLVLRQAVENDLVPAADTGLGHDLLIPKGTAIAVGITSVHMNPKYWPNPTRYDPSRFVGLDMDTVQYCFLPFINGPRNCLGQHLSLTEAQLVLSYILGRTRLGLPDGFKAVPHKFMAPQVPEAGLPVNVQAATPMTKRV